MINYVTTCITLCAALIWSKMAFARVAQAEPTMSADMVAPSANYMVAPANPGAAKIAPMNTMPVETADPYTVDPIIIALGLFTLMILAFAIFLKIREKKQGNKTKSQNDHE